MLQVSKNTSFSAVGHLCDRGGKTTVTLYENVFAKVKVPYSQLPACFDVRRIDVPTPSDCALNVSRLGDDAICAMRIYKGSP